MSRLYALGYDACQLLPEILRPAVPGPFGGGELAGATGMLYADTAGRIHRRLLVRRSPRRAANGATFPP